MSSVQKFIADLRERKLLPVVALLLIAIVAVPIALSKSAAPAPATTPTPGAITAPTASALPAVSLQSASAAPVKLNAHPHNPFVQGVTRKLHAAVAKSVAAGGAASSATSATTSTSTSAAGSSTSTTTTQTITTSSATEAPGTLLANQSYTVAIAMTRGNGIVTRDPLERLSPLPSNRLPLLIELGVLRGGKRVLFAVHPGAVLVGGGKCSPRPADCQLLSLGLGEIEGVGYRTAAGTAPITQLAVTAIRVADHASAAAAAKVRTRQSRVGAAVLKDIKLGALSRFTFDQGLDAMVPGRAPRAVGRS